MDPARGDDPFAQLDEPRTFIKPNPGGTRITRPRPFDDTGAGFAAVPPPPPADLPQTGLNRLVALANPLLLLVPPAAPHPPSRRGPAFGRSCSGSS